MRVGGGQDERHADHLRPEQGERRHAVAGLPEVLDQRELAVGVGTDEPAVHLEVLRRRREIALGERGVVLAQEDLGLDGGIAGIAGVAGIADRPHRPAVAHQRAADEIDLVHRAPPELQWAIPCSSREVPLPWLTRCQPSRRSGR